MPRKPPADLAGTARKLAYGYACACVALLVVAALRTPALEPWFWRALLVVVALAVSLRSAVVYLYRKQPSKLNWWLRPTTPAERELDTTWLVYAVVLGAASVLFVLM